MELLMPAIDLGSTGLTLPLFMLLLFFSTLTRTCPLAGQLDARKIF
ncbi:MAG: hypothetical protein QOH41_513 [Blastocatellia bacterium]|nr:hypothetical protein [Blastocatellia bacterium]